MAASPFPSSDEQFSIGSVLDGRYRIDGVLGTGGMGRVYRAEHTKIGKSVAIKVLHADLHRNREASQRFQREAIASGRLDHPNIVGVSDFGVLDDGACYLVMEVLEGESLGDRLAREGRIHWVEAIDILRGVLAGLRHAHERGVVHRDIKPDNVYLAHKDGDSMIKILDFGIAKLYAGSADDPASTRAGLTVGTPAYLSPEQAVGGEITPASDLYSASIVMYEMLAGHAPFEDRDPLAMLGAHVSRRPPAFSVTAPGVDIPPPLEELIQRGLVKAAAERIATATDYLAMLDALSPPIHQPRLSTSPGVLLSTTEALGTAATGVAMSALAAGSPARGVTTPLPTTGLPLPGMPPPGAPGLYGHAPTHGVGHGAIPASHATPFPGFATPVPGTASPASHATPFPGFATSHADGHGPASGAPAPGNEAPPHGPSPASAASAAGSDGVPAGMAPPASGGVVLPTTASAYSGGVAAMDRSTPYSGGVVVSAGSSPYSGSVGVPDPAAYAGGVPASMATPHAGSAVMPTVATPHAGSAVMPSMATPHAGSAVMPSMATPHAGSAVMPSMATPHAGSAVMPSMATPFAGSAVVPGTATPAAGSAVAPGPLVGAPMPRASRMVSLADVKEPIPKSWIVRSGALIGFVIVAAIVLAFVKHCGGSSAAPSPTTPAGTGSGVASGAATGSGAAPGPRPTTRPAAGSAAPAAASGSGAGSAHGADPGPPTAAEAGSAAAPPSASSSAPPATKPAPKPPVRSAPGHRPRPH